MDMTRLWGSLIGVFGTALGSFLGRLFSKKSNKKLVLTLVSYHVNIKEKSNNKIDLYLDIYAYNPSDNIKIMRDLQIEYAQRNGEVKTFDVRDLNNIYTLGSAFRFPKNIALENLPPKIGVLFNAVVYLNNVNIYEDGKWEIIYLDEKGRKEKVVIQLPILNNEN